MKKFLNISVIAALAILPLAANAAVTDADPGQTNADAPAATYAPKYSLAQADANVDGVVATAGYVKGAYNAAIKAINKVATTADGAVKSVTDGSTNGTIVVDGNTINVYDDTTLSGKVSALETTVGDNTDGLVKDVADNTSAISNLQTTVASKADAATTLSGYGITDAYTKTEVDNAIESGAVQTVASGTANGTIKVDGTDVAVTGWAGKQDALDTDQMAAVNSGIDSTKVAKYEQLVTASDNYATKTGVTTTVTNAFTNATADLSGLSVTNNAVQGNATARVPVMANWGDTQASNTPVSATVDLSGVTSNVALNGNTTGAVTSGTIAYPQNP